MADHDYETGLRDGKIASLEKMVSEHANTLSRHYDRITAQERITWLVLGGILLIQFVPVLKKVFL